MKFRSTILFAALLAALSISVHAQAVVPQIGSHCDNLGINQEIPVFARIGSTVYGCLNNGWQVLIGGTPGTNAEAWQKYSVLFEASGTGACLNSGGCWQVTNIWPAMALAPPGSTTVNATAGLTQSVVLFNLPANGYISQYRKKTKTACAGTTTMTLKLGDASGSSYYSTTAYDLKAAVTATNIENAAPAHVGSSTAAAIDVSALITTTVDNITATTACAFDVWFKWGILP